MVFVFNMNFFQSVNFFWVILFILFVVGFFVFLCYWRMEFFIFIKMVLGFIFIVLSCIVMVMVVNVSLNGVVKVLFWWFIGLYGVLIIGELCLSLMGLSFVLCLSFVRLMVVMMGGWFLVMFIGNKMFGVLSIMWDSYDNKVNFFWVDCCLLVCVVFVLFFVLLWLNCVFKEYVGG